MKVPSLYNGGCDRVKEDPNHYKRSIKDLNCYPEIEENFEKITDKVLSFLREGNVTSAYEFLDKSRARIQKNLKDKYNFSLKMHEDRNLKTSKVELYDIEHVKIWHNYYFSGIVDSIYHNAGLSQYYPDNFKSGLPGLKMMVNHVAEVMKEQGESEYNKVVAEIIEEHNYNKGKRNESDFAFSRDQITNFGDLMKEVTE